MLRQQTLLGRTILFLVASKNCGYLFYIYMVYKVYRSFSVKFQIGCHKF